MDTIEAYASNIISPYHRIGVLAFLQYYSSADRPVETYVLIEKGNWDHHLLAQEQLRGQYFKAGLVEGTTKFNLTNLFRAALALLFQRDRNTPNCLVIGHSRVNIRLIASLFARNIINGSTRIATVVIDEGIGTYGSFRYRYMAFCRENQPGLINKLLYHLIYPINQHLLKSRQLIDFDWRLLHNQDDGELTRNEIAISGYRDAFIKAGNEICVLPNNTDILFVTAPLVDLGLLQADDYHTILERLHDISTNAGILVKVKCHPAEQKDLYHKYGFPLIEEDVAAEALISALRPSMVLGFTSTALINSMLIFSIRSYSILDLLSCSKELRATHLSDRNIQSIFSKYVEFIPDWSVLEACINQLSEPSEQPIRSS